MQALNTSTSMRIYIEGGIKNMKNKILAILLVGMFLLTFLTTLSAVGMKAGVSGELNDVKQIETNNDDLPDLTIKLKIIPLLQTYMIKPTVQNKGTATIPKGEYLIYKMDMPDETQHWWREELFEPLNPGESHNSRVRPGVSKNMIKRREITVVIDPPAEDNYPWPELNPDPVYGLIIESNEDNNVYTGLIPKVKTHNQYRPLYSLLNRLPIFQRILEKLDLI